jgi:hypothetical protein
MEEIRSGGTHQSVFHPKQDILEINTLSLSIRVNFRMRVPFVLRKESVLLE